MEALPSPSPSRLGDTDPTEGVLSPWMWVPILLAVLLPALLISFRTRAQLISLWERCTETCFPRRIRLGESLPISTPRRARSGSMDTTGSDDSQDDELPTRSPMFPPRRSGLEGMLADVGDRIGWLGLPGTQRRTGVREAGIGTAFWGRPRHGVRLTDDGEFVRGRQGSAEGWSSLPRTVLERVSNMDTLSILSTSRPSSSRPAASPRASSSPSLFDLGEEEDADELPHDFEPPPAMKRGTTDSSLRSSASSRG